MKAKRVTKSDLYDLQDKLVGHFMDVLDGGSDVPPQVLNTIMSFLKHNDITADLTVIPEGALAKKPLHERIKGLRKTEEAFEDSAIVA